MKADGTREQVGEEPDGLAQEGAFGFYPSELLKEREGENLGVRELLEGGLVFCSWVEMDVGVVDLAEQDSYRLFQEGEPCSMLGMWTCPGTTDSRTLRIRGPRKEVSGARSNTALSAGV